MKSTSGGYNGTPKGSAPSGPIKGSPFTGAVMPSKGGKKSK